MQAEELREFVEKVDAPVCDTLMGKGAYDGTTERLYRNAWYARNKDIESMVFHECDLLIVVGARFQ